MIPEKLFDSTANARTDPEWRRRSGEPNQPGEDFPHDLCLHQLFEVQAQRWPEAVAVTCEGDQLTYKELNARANHLAHFLRGLGVGPETLVGVCLERSLEMIVAVLGILKAGGAYVPLDPGYPPERLAFMLTDAAVMVAVTQRSLKVPIALGTTPLVYVEETKPGNARLASLNPRSGASPDNLAYVIYTSGSTGQPKGVMVTHRSVVELFRATDVRFHFGPQDVWTLFHSVSFDFSVWEIWGALLFGGRLVVVPYWKSRSPMELSKILNREKVTVLNQTPSAFRQFIAAEERAAAQEPLHLRLVILGGETLAPGSLKLWFDRHGDQTPQLVNMYGITETTVHVSYRRMRLADCLGPSVIGGPIPNVEMLLLDSKQQIVPVGSTGEIYVGGVGLARGYWRRPDLTRERFIPHPFRKEPGARLYKSGDLARHLPGGDIEFLGRADQQVKIRGFRIELGEVEAALSMHPNIKDVVVTVKQDPRGESYLVALVVVRRGPAPTATELRNFLKQKLPDYMTPSGFVFLENLPLDPSGKINRQCLPDGSPALSNARQRVVAPSTSVERQLMRIWERLLGVQPFGVRDNFFDLGGHSLLAIQLLWQVQNEFGKTVPLSALLRRPTIEQFARMLTERESSVPLAATGRLRGAESGTPLFYIPGIHGVGLLPEPLARAIGRVCPYHDGLQYAGVDGQQPPLTRVEDIAAHLILQIRQVCPKGPYRLCGYSFGGVVAYEAARQMRAQNLGIETLILWDCWTPQAITQTRRPLRQVMTELSRRMRAVQVVEQPQVMWKLLQNKFRFIGARYTKKLATQWSKDTTQLLCEASMQAFEAYRPGSFAGSAILFRTVPLVSENILSTRLIRELNGWGGLITGNLEEIELSCDHDTMWKPPMLEVLAEKTTAFLQRCASRTPDIESTRTV